MRRRHSDSDWDPIEALVNTDWRVGSHARKAVSAYAVGVGLFHFGMRAHRQYRAAQQTVQAVRDRMAYTLTIYGRDEVYEDVRDWMYAQLPEKRRRAQVVRFDRHRNEWGESEGTVSLRADGDQEITANLDGHKVHVRSSNSQNMGYRSDDVGSLPWLNKNVEVTFTVHSKAAQAAVVGLLEGFAAERYNGRERRPELFVVDKYGSFERRNDLPPRPIETVVLAEGQKERIIGDVEQFLAEEPKYTSIGMPYHRGYLFHGPPGTGKTSIAKALANHFGMDIYYIPLSAVKEDASLLALIGNLRSGSILLLEDIDVVHGATKSRAEDDDDKLIVEAQGGVTLGGLLNALDGVSTPHGLITIMTSNHVDRLDDALVRPGRVDMNEEIGYLDEAQLVGLMEMFFGEECEGVLEGPLRPQLTPADVVEVLKHNINDPSGAYKEINERFVSHPLRSLETTVPYRTEGV